jgi:hypothetical protein
MLMRVEKFDEEVTGALRHLGFEVADDNESATIGDEQLAVEIIQPSGNKEYLLTITLPNGRLLVGAASRSAIVTSAN